MNIKKKLRKAAVNADLKAKVKSWTEKRQAWRKKAIELKRRLVSEENMEERLKFDLEIIELTKLMEKSAKYSSVRYRNKCRITSRASGLRLGASISRHMMRKYASLGFVIGVKKV